MGSDSGTGHEWLVAAYVKLDDGQVVQAADRGRVSVRPGTIVDVQELLCGKCRKPYHAVFDAPCAADTDNTHLIGGTPGERAKRAHRHDCFALGCDTAKVVAARQQATARGQVGLGR